MIFIKKAVLYSQLEDTNYVKNLPVFQSLNKTGEISFTHNVTFLVGENGTGKSTLLEAIAVAYGFNPEGGTLNFNFKTRDSHSDLHQHLGLIRDHHRPRDAFFLRAESFYNVASYIDDVEVTKSYGGKSLHTMSHGESFLTLIEQRLSGDGLYLLDEPEAALSPMRIMTFMVLLQQLVDSGSQCIIATHSPILMAFPQAEILEFSESGIQSVSLEETEHYKITKDFLDNPKRMLHYLLDSE